MKIKEFLILLFLRFNIFGVKGDTEVWYLKAEEVSFSWLEMWCVLQPTQGMAYTGCMAYCVFCPPRYARHGLYWLHYLPCDLSSTLCLARIGCMAYRVFCPPPHSRNCLCWLQPLQCDLFSMLTLCLACTGHVFFFRES